eukprot:1465186-Rhodomonas_salina.1
MRNVLGYHTDAALLHGVGNAEIFERAGLLHSKHKYELQAQTTVTLLNKLSEIMNIVFPNWSEIIGGYSRVQARKWEGKPSH